MGIPWSFGAGGTQSPPGGACGVWVWPTGPSWVSPVWGQGRGESSWSPLELPGGGNVLRGTRHPIVPMGHPIVPSGIPLSQGPSHCPLSHPIVPSAIPCPLGHPTVPKGHPIVPLSIPLSPQPLHCPTVLLATPLSPQPSHCPTVHPTVPLSIPLPVHSQGWGHSIPWGQGPRCPLGLWEQHPLGDRTPAPLGGRGHSSPQGCQGTAVPRRPHSCDRDTSMQL